MNKYLKIMAQVPFGWLIWMFLFFSDIRIRWMIIGIAMGLFIMQVMFFCALLIYQKELDK